MWNPILKRANNYMHVIRLYTFNDCQSTPVFLSGVAKGWNVDSGRHNVDTGPVFVRWTLRFCWINYVILYAYHVWNSKTGIHRKSIIQPTFWNHGLQCSKLRRCQQQFANNTAGARLKLHTDDKLVPLGIFGKLEWQQDVTVFRMQVSLIYKQPASWK